MQREQNKFDRTKEGRTTLLTCRHELAVKQELAAAVGASVRCELCGHELALNVGGFVLALAKYRADDSSRGFRLREEAN